MRSYLPAYELRLPADLKEALHLLATEPRIWRPFAGGTDLMVLFEAGKLEHKKFLSLWHLSELQGIEVNSSSVRLGSLTTYAEIQKNKTIREEFPLLCEAASLTGAVAIQNRGTLGGNIANASPAADSPPALLVYDAVLELISIRGSRWIPYTQFHLGYKKTELKEDEIIGSIRLSRNTKGAEHYYRKVGTRKMQAISKICFAGVGFVEEKKIQEVRIALGSVAPIPLRCVQTEKFLQGQMFSSALIKQARQIIVSEIVPIDDIRSTALYRNRVVENLLAEFLESL